MIGKKIMAMDKTRRRNIGVIDEITETEVKVFDKNNPQGYQNYTLARSDFDKWVEQKLYVLRKA
jgi:hypothetical protein